MDIHDRLSEVGMRSIVGALGGFCGKNSTSLQFAAKSFKNKPMARPRKTVDPTKLHNLALIGLTNEKIAQAVGVSRDTLERRYRAVIEAGRGDGETRILAKIFQKAMSGCMRALELSLVNRCGWTNRPEVAIQVTQNAGVPPDTRSPEQIRQHLLELQRSVLEEALREQEAETQALPSREPAA